MKNLINKIPKAELHLHIEGTLEADLMFELAQKNNIKLPYRDLDDLKAAYNFNNLQEFLDLYYLGTNVLFFEEDFYQLTYNYLKKAHSQGVVHSEFFFDPQAHTERGIEFSTIIKGIHRAKLESEREFGITSFIIMSFLRHLSEEEAFKTLNESLKYKSYISGIGLDSSERGNPPEKFTNVFKEAKKLGFKLMAHAGEEGPAEYIKTSIETLKVDRIDHGNEAINDKNLLAILAEKRIPMTLCPLSNLELKVVRDLNQHPLKKMMSKNLLVTVNSDDPAYFGGYINENYEEIQKALNLNKNDIKKLAQNSFEASFLDDEIKKKFIDIIKAF